MKQGQILNRIVMLLLTAAIAVYVGVSAVRSLSDPLTTAISYAYTVDDVVEATGYLARTETVLPRQSLIADVLPAEGEKVAKGEVVAYLYQDAAAMERRSQIRALALQVEQLEYTVSKAGDERDNARLTEEILDGIVALRAAVERRELTDLAGDALDLKSLVYKRDNAYNGGDVTAVEAEISSLNQQIQALQAAAQADTTVITTEEPGIFSGVVDGYESLLTPQRLDSLTPSSLQAIAAAAKADEGAVGKLITDTRWYFVCTLPEDEARRLVKGESVTVRFSRDWSGEVSMDIERLSEPENGQVLVVLSSRRYLSDTTLLRRQTVELVFDSRTGIRVPKEAVRVETRTAVDKETGAESTWQETGVYAMVGAQAEFKPVTILTEGEDFFLVEPAPFSNPENLYETKKALRAGDEIVVRAEDLYDGKVLRAG